MSSALSVVYKAFYGFIKHALIRFLDAVLLLVFVAVPARGGYEEMAREYETYEPPALYRELIKPRPATLPVPGVGQREPAVPSAGLVPATAPRRLSQLQDQEAEVEAFYRPDPVRLAALQSAAVDTAAAARALAGTVPLTTIEILALLRSPEVAAKASEFQAALEGYSQVENLDTVLRRYSAFTASVMTGVGAMEQPGAAAMQYPFPGDLGLRGEVIGFDARAARYRLEAARRDAVTAGRRAFWNLHYTHQALEITGQMLDLLENLRVTASARYSSGEANFQDAIRVSIEQEKAKEDLRSLTEERRNAEEEIRQTLNLPVTVAIGVPDSVSSGPAGRSRAIPDARDTTSVRSAAPTLDHLFALALQKRQELVAMRAMATRMERMIEMAESMTYPGYSQNLSLYEKDELSRVAGGGMAEGKENFAITTSAAMGVGVPKASFYGMENAYLRETRSRLAALNKEIEAAEASTRLAVRKAWFLLDKAQREKALYGERIVLLAQEALEAATRGYATGKVPFYDVISSYTGWFAAQLSLDRARADVGLGRAEVEAAVGAGMNLL